MKKIEKTAFITQDGLWKFNVLPQGIMNGSPIFQPTIHNHLGYGRWDYVMVYLDNILVFSHNFNGHKQHLNEILSILVKAKFQVNPDKCSIAVREIDFVSHTINELFIKSNGHKIKAINDLPAPKTLKEANEFLGKINWYQPDQQHSFVLTNDASEVGIGGILRQDMPTGTKISYYKSRVLNDIERIYATFEKEALVIYWCITELRSYIGDSSLTVETDHKPLEKCHTKQLNNKRVMNWLFKLQDILPQVIAVKNRKSANNTAADYISRHFPSVAILNTGLSTVSEPCDDWPTDSQHWSEDTSKPQHTQITQSSISRNTSIRNTAMNVKINAVTTRAQAKLLAQAPPSPQTISSTPHASQNAPSSSPSSNQLYDFSLLRMRSEQGQDPAVQQIIQQVHNRTCHKSFIIQHDILYKLVRRGNTNIKLLYAPSTVIPGLLAAYHDHHLSGHFDVERTWLALKNTYFWPHMKELVTSYI
ncbi:unnamed protein product [Rotaria sp. Silwood2]|nr:unnamed protein product [Rotaria sp. Silwood2]